MVLGEATRRLDRLEQQQAQQGAAQPAGTTAAAAAAAAGAAGAKRAGGKRGRAAAAAAAAASEQEPERELGQDAGELRASAARALALVCLMVEYHRGARVEDYAPLFRLAARTAGAEVWGVPCAEQQQQEGQREQQGQQAQLGGALAAPPSDDGWEALESPSLTWQALRLMLALVHSHAKVAGASAGPAASSARRRSGQVSRPPPPQMQTLHLQRAKQGAKRLERGQRSRVGAAACSPRCRCLPRTLPDLSPLVLFVLSRPANAT